MSDMLSADELEALDLTAKVANLLKKIINAPYKELAEETNRLLAEGDHKAAFHAGMHLEDIKACGDNDWNEAASAIHVIQNMLQAQASARAYPERFRLMGDIGQWRRT